jgi:hypothetical protein
LTSLTQLPLPFHSTFTSWEILRTINSCLHSHMRELSNTEYLPGSQLWTKHWGERCSIQLSGKQRQ